MFKLIMSELTKLEEYSGIIADYIATILAAEIFRSEPVKPSIDTNNDKHKQLLSWISDNFSHISFEEAAKYMNFSKSYFARYFQNISGMKFTRYINVLKISAAVKMISEGSMNMTEISIAC